MATAGVKFDDGSGTFASNCFPVRTFGKTSDEVSGAWLIAHHAEQRRRFKAVLCAKPRTYSRLKEERKKTELHGTKLGTYKFQDDTDEEEEEAGDDGRILDGFFLMKHCCVDDPADLCSVNIANKELVDIKEEDLSLFENVAYVNAGENYLPFEAFRGFPSLRELEIPLNGLRNLKISHTDFSSLEMLDLSYNNLCQDDLLALGLLRHLKVLHLTGNGFTNVPQDLAMPYLSREKQVRLERFPRLEVLLLDDNKFIDMTVFAALAGLPKLRHLNMAKNEIFFVPQLKSVEGRVVTQDGHGKKRHRPRSAASGVSLGQDSKASGKYRPRSGKVSGERERSDVDSSKNMDSKHIDTNEAHTETCKVKAAINIVNDVKTAEKKEKEECSENNQDLPLGESANGAIVEDRGKTSVAVEKPTDFDADDLNHRIEELSIDQEETSATLFPQSQVLPKLPPFPELRYLNLANNKIQEEDALLAVAAWPMLVELDIQGNPLTMETSGDPPLVRRFLMERLGIKVNRIKPQAEYGFFNKAKVEIRPQKRKVTELVPKVPKLSLDERMRLALAPPPAPPKHSVTPPFKERKTQGKGNSVLPPIPTTPKRELTEAWADRILEEEEDDVEEEQDDRDKMRVEDNASRAFFMTQVDDQGELLRITRSKAKDSSVLAEGEVDDLHEPVVDDKEVDDRYKGYELLLDIEELEDEPELPPTKDIQGNIRALKHTLNHMLVYRDPAVELTKVKMTVPEFRRAPMPPACSKPSYQERVDSVLTQLKVRSTVDEEKLMSVLKDKTRLQGKFPEAEELLGQIQRRYNAVRAHSLKDAKMARNITSDVIDLLPPPTTKLAKSK